MKINVVRGGINRLVSKTRRRGSCPSPCCRATGGEQDPFLGTFPSYFSFLHKANTVLDQERAVGAVHSAFSKVFASVV